MTEERPVPGYPGYRARSDGTILGLSGSPIRGSKDRDGYHKITLRGPDGRKTLRRAHVILTTFVGPRPPGCESLHFPDRDPGNNSVSNLRWGTHQENIADKLVAQTQARGEGHGRARLTDEQVETIRREYVVGRPHHPGNGAELAARFGITRSHVSLLAGNSGRRGGRR